VNIRTIKLLTLSLFLAGLTGCSDGSEEVAPVINTGKAIQSFKINIHYPNQRAVAGVIDEVTKKITLNLGIDDECENNSATAIISAGATILPAPSILADYEKPVTFTVTAEDKTSETYTIEINRAKFEVSSVSKQSFQPGEVMTINGKNFSSSKYYLSVLLVDNGKEQRLQEEGDTYYPDKTYVQIREDQEIGSYELRVKLEDYDSVIWPTPIVIDFPNHNTTITEIVKEKVLMGGDPALYAFRTFIRGRFLGNTSLSDISNAKVYMVKKTDESFKQELKMTGVGTSDKYTYFNINADIPNGTLSVGDYYIDIEFKGQTYRYGQVLTYPW
jgi:hypothetical protein